MGDMIYLLSQGGPHSARRFKFKVSLSVIEEFSSSLKAHHTTGIKHFHSKHGLRGSLAREAAPPNVFLKL